MYKLDKSFSKTSTLEEASSSYEYWKTKTLAERLAAGIYLTKTAYQIVEWPAMEKHISSTGKL